MGTVANVKVSRDEKNWEVEVSAEIGADTLASYRDKALAEMQKSAKLDGFRPGHAPIERLIAVYGEEAIMRRAVEMAIQGELPELLAAEKLLVIEAPRVTTNTPVTGKPLSFTAKAPLAPHVELGHYKAIAAKHPKEETSVSDEEHAEALTHIRRERARIDKIESGTEPQKAADESRVLKLSDLPEIDDVFTTSLGYPDTAAFSDALRTNIKNEKELRAVEKRRSAILEAIVKDSKISYPTLLREYELDDMEARIKDDLTKMHVPFEKYLEQIQKTRDELRESWREAADARARVRLVLSEIARQEKIEPDQAALDKEVSHARKQYPQADPAVLRTHIAHAMRNDAVLRFLEKSEG